MTEFPKGRGYKRIGIENDEVRLAVKKQAAGYALEMRLLRSDDERPVSCVEMSAATVDFLIMMLTKLRLRMGPPAPVAQRTPGWREEP